MAEGHIGTAERASPSSGITLPDLSGRVTIRDPGALTRLVYRGVDEVLGRALEIATTGQPCRAETLAGVSMLWLGPDERLVIAPEDQAATLLSRIEAAAGGVPCSVVDVSHRNTALVLEGPRVANLLNAACPLDLETSRFPVGMCTRTVFGKAEIVLWRTAAERFHVEVWRSFLPYVAGLMAEASRDLT